MEDQTFEVNVIENMTSEHREELKLKTESEFELELETESEFKLDSIDFDLDQIVESAVNWASSPSSPNLEPTKLTPPSIEPFPSIELKVLPKHLKYVYLDKQETLSVIIASHLIVGHEESLMSLLRKYKKAIGWTMTVSRG